ncbi:hypothetical protein QTP70_018168 [Hemibagrus guttatus]|uniref:Coiled-coil domain containing 150 n=1 Tax=Hemibagrus guttatus TaxID=175788 RepID=A0AAE0QTP7_9TELE|nr:hypothetical protein QTP70_018168 [Hemibagrus guttatus]
MFRSVMKPLSAGASLPEPLSLLHRRIRVAEGQGAELAKKLGVSGDELGAEFMDSSQCEALVARVCRLESLFHAVRLNVFRIETARELTSSHTAHLQEQFTALQEQCKEEQRSSQREVMRLRDQLQQEREEAQKEAQTLREQLHSSYCSQALRLICWDSRISSMQVSVLDSYNRSFLHLIQMDVAVAADELKKVKVQLSWKLHQLKEELVQETAARLEAEQSHDDLLQKVKETEGEVERAKEQVKLLQTDCHTLNVDGQEMRAELEEKAELIESLQEECQQLRQQIGEQHRIMGNGEFCKCSSVKITLQKQQQENSTLTRGREELRAATDKVQALNDQLETQCSDLSSALRSLTEEKAQLLASLKESWNLWNSMGMVCFLPGWLLISGTTASARISACLVDISSWMTAHQLKLNPSKTELLVIPGDPSPAQDLAISLNNSMISPSATARNLGTEQEHTAQLLKDVDLQLDTAKRNMQCEVQEALADRHKINKELETLKADHFKLQQSSAAALDAAVNHQELLERTIRRLRGELSNTIKEGETLQKEREEVNAVILCVCRAGVCEDKLQKSAGATQTGAGGVKGEGMSDVCAAFRDRIFQRENLRLKDQLHNTHMKNAETLQTELGEKLDMLHTLRRQRGGGVRAGGAETELHTAKQEINQLTKQVNELRRAKHHGRRSAQQELKKALDDVSSRSCDLSRSNQELREKVCELENLVSNRIKAQAVQLKQRNKTELNNSARSQSLEQLRIDVASLQAELLDLSSSQQEELQAERHLTHTLQEKCAMLEECVVKLKQERYEAKRKMDEVSLESQQISENLQEAHSWFRSKFNSLKSGLEQSQVPLHEETGHFRNSDRNEASLEQDTCEVVCVAEPELERWATTLQRWENEKAQDRTANGCKAAARTHSLT